MNLAELFEKYDFHDSYIDYFNYDPDSKRLILCVVLCEGQETEKCEITFLNVRKLNIEADNDEYEENELVSVSVSSDDGEYFKGFFSEGFGKAGKLIEIKCDKVRYSLL